MKKLLLCVSLIALAGCSTTDKKEIVGQDSELYNKGMNALYAKNYKSAINFFEELDRQHPYSEVAQKAKVMTIFAHFEDEEYDEAIYEADKFMQENIGYKDLDYVYYIKGLSYYNRISDVKRDQGNTKKAYESFKQLENRFPNSKYSKDAKQKMGLCYENLAGKEMEVGRFYQNRGNMLAAVNRFQTVVRNYDKSTHTPEALYRIAEIYTSMGIEDEVVRSLSILGYNYSGDSKWYKKGYDLVVNIDDHEKKFQNEKWYTELKKSVKNLFDN